MTVIDLFDDIPVFVGVVEAGSFSTAAKRFKLSRSAVGKMIARLEQRLGVRLFQRTTRSQSLTDDGQAFYEHCQHAIVAVQAGTTMLETGRKTVAGTLRVTMPVLFGRICVAPILTRLADANPELTLELDFRDRHVDLIDAGMDLAVRNGPIGVGTGLRSRRIARRRTLVCAAPSYVERCGSPQSLDDLDRHEAVTYSRDGRRQTWSFPGRDGPPTEVTPHSRLRLDDLGAMLDAVTAGRGIAWLPDWLVSESLRTGALVELLSDLPSQFSDIHLLWPEAPQLPLRIRVTIDALVEGFSDIVGK